MCFNMNVLGYHQRSIDTEVEIEFTDFETLLKSSDIVTLHIPLNDRTRYLIGQRELASMGEDAFVINTSRGPVVDETAMIEVLQSKKSAGLGSMFLKLSLCRKIAPFGNRITLSLLLIEPGLRMDSTFIKNATNSSWKILRGCLRERGRSTSTT
jgi:hypothetical protein